MMQLDLQQLVQALDAPSRQDLEAAAERCMQRGGNKVLVEDLLLGLLERPDSLLARALQDAEIDAGSLAETLVPRGQNEGSNNPSFSAELVQWLQDALLVANLELASSGIDQAALILALLRNPMRYAGTRYQTILSGLDAERLRDFALSKQATGGSDTAASGESALQKFTHNFTQQARNGKLDPVLCRDQSIRQMIDILARRRKNNPIVVGEAGVGKTALVEGLALRIANNAVPEALRDVELLCLDLGLLQAGASIKGEFERRLQGVIDEVKASSRPRWGYFCGGARVRKKPRHLPARRCRGCRRRTLSALSRWPSATRQGRRCTRHRLRPRAHQPGCRTRCTGSPTR